VEEYTGISLIIAGLALISGLLLVVAPGLLIKAGEFFNRVYNVESIIYTKRVPFGILYLIAGATLFYLLW